MRNSRAMDRQGSVPPFKSLHQMSSVNVTWTSDFNVDEHVIAHCLDNNASAYLIVSIGNIVIS